MNRRVIGACEFRWKMPSHAFSLGLERAHKPNLSSLKHYITHMASVKDVKDMF